MVRKWTDEALLAEGRKYASRTAFARGSQSAYATATRRPNILDQLYPSLRGELRKLSDETLLAEGRKYASRKEFECNDDGAYQKARKRGLLDLLYPNTNSKWKKSGDNDLLAEGRKYASRTEFHKHAKGAYDEANTRDLLNLLYPSQQSHPKWTDEALLAEGRKYASRKEFNVGSNPAYRAACRRNLLDLIDWPEENARSNNDAIYIWRAVGQYFNGQPVYKIGVTSARLGARRVEHVARVSGFEFDLICCETVQGKASDLERKLLILGESPGFVGFSGATEFRALSDSALYAAITLICNVI